MFLEHLKAIRIDEEIAGWLLTAIKEFDAKRQAEREQTLARHQDHQQRVQKKIDQAYDDNWRNGSRRSTGWSGAIAGRRS